MTWSKGQPWRVVRSLERLREQIRAAYPQAVPPATPVTAWGSIADSAHSTTSDHYPHYYSVLGSTAVVCARDFPHAPALGLDAHALADRLRASRDPRIGYVISNGRITGPNYGWRWASYSGSDPHDTHIHVSTVHTAAADDARDWQIGEDVDMTPEQARQLDELHETITRWRSGMPTMADGKRGIEPVKWRQRDETWQASVGANLATLAGKDWIDEPSIVAGVLAGLTPEKIAAAIPDTLAKQVADELTARLAS